MVKQNVHRFDIWLVRLYVKKMPVIYLVALSVTNYIPGTFAFAMCKQIPVFDKFLEFFLYCVSIGFCNGFNLRYGQFSMILHKVNDLP